MITKRDFILRGRCYVRRKYVWRNSYIFLRIILNLYFVVAMAPRAIREFDGKKILSRYLNVSCGNVCDVTPDTDLAALPKLHPWLLEHVCFLLTK